MDLQGQETRWSPVAGEVVDQLTVEGDANPGPGGLDQVGVPLAYGDDRDTGRGLQPVDRACAVDALPGRVSGADVVDLDLVALHIGLVQGIR